MIFQTFILAVINMLLLLVLCLNADVELPDQILDSWEAAGKTEVFEGKNLYGHINGGAELFYEFGFQELLVRRYRHNEEQIIAEAYLMSDSIAALGIYLHRVHNEKPIAGIDARNSGNAYQIACVKDNVFLQVLNPGGNKKNTDAMKFVINRLLETVRHKNADSIFNTMPEGMLEGTAGIFRGPLALQPIYTFGPGDIFLQENERLGLYARYRINSDTVTHLRIFYESQEMKRKAFQNLVKRLDPYLEVVYQGNNRLIFRDYSDKYGEVELLDKHLSININLSTLPSVE